jgi:hypothetical protein
MDTDNIPTPKAYEDVLYEDTLVERLRFFPLFFRNGSKWVKGVGDDPICLEAASHITKLREKLTLAQQEIERLKQQAVPEGCICFGNWREIVKEVGPLFGKHYRDPSGCLFDFFGLVHRGDDFYYGMSGISGLRLLSCVGSIESYGFNLLFAPQPKSE